MRHAAGHHHTSASGTATARQMVPNLMAGGPTRSAMHVVGQEQLGAGWMGCAEAGFFAAGVRASTKKLSKARKIKILSCSANL